MKSNNATELLLKAKELSLLFLQGRVLREGRNICVNGEIFRDFCTAGYLGLDLSEDFFSEAESILKESGIGRCSSPVYLAPIYYSQIETEIKRITGLDDVTLFSSNSLANRAAIRWATSGRSKIYIDSYSHLSLIDALMGFHKSMRFPHLDYGYLGECLNKLSTSERFSIITDGVFSMSGASPDLSLVGEMVRNKNATLIIDDAHGLGVCGNKGEGSLRWFKQQDKDVLSRIVYTGSLSKALPGCGGFVACSSSLGTRIRERSAQFGFSCSIPHIYAALAARGCSFIGTEIWRKAVDKLRDNWNILSSGLILLGRSLVADFSPVAVMRFKSVAEAINVVIALKKNKIAFNIVGFPAVPLDDFRLRLCLSAAHTQQDIEALLYAIRSGLE